MRGDFEELGTILFWSVPLNIQLMKAWTEHPTAEKWSQWNYCLLHCSSHLSFSPKHVAGNFLTSFFSSSFTFEVTPSYFDDFHRAFTGTGWGDSTCFFLFSLWIRLIRRTFSATWSFGSGSAKMQCGHLYLLITTIGLKCLCCPGHNLKIQVYNQIKI